jgi:hypothetical protein
LSKKKKPRLQKRIDGRTWRFNQEEIGRLLKEREAEKMVGSVTLDLSKAAGVSPKK